MRLLDFLPSKGMAAVLEAFFDESERTGGTFCVAGYAFPKPQAIQFTKEWSRLFAGIKGGLHMVDLLHRKEAFEGISNSERDRFVVEAVKIINRRMSIGVAVSCNLAEVKRYAPAWVTGFGHAYPLCCHLAMTSLGAHLDKQQNPESVMYIFESGHQYEGEARRFMANAVQNPDAKRSYRHYGDSFVPKSGAVPLQAADLLAYEWGKFKDETLDKKTRPMRKSFRELVRSSPGRYAVHHVTGTPLVKFMARIHALGLLQQAEERGPVAAP